MATRNLTITEMQMMLFMNWMEKNCAVKGKRISQSTLDIITF